MNINDLLEAISLLIINTPINQKDLTTNLRYVLSHTAKSENPNASIAQLASLTNLNRGVISKHLEEEKPRKVVSKDSMILKECFINSKKGILPIHGDNSFYSIANKYPLDYSATSVLDNLIRSGCIKHHDEHHIKIKSDRMIVNNNEHESIRILCKNVLRLTETILHNMRNNDKKFQFTFKTKSVEPSKIEELHITIFNHLKNIVIKEIQEIIERYELDGEYNFPEYSVSIFENF